MKMCSSTQVNIKDFSLWFRVPIRSIKVCHHLSCLSGVCNINFKGNIFGISERQTDCSWLNIHPTNKATKIRNESRRFIRWNPIGQCFFIIIIYNTRNNWRQHNRYLSGCALNKRNAWNRRDRLLNFHIEIVFENYYVCHDIWKFFKKKEKKMELIRR